MGRRGKHSGLTEQEKVAQGTWNNGKQRRKGALLWHLLCLWYWHMFVHLCPTRPLRYILVTLCGWGK